MIEKDKTKKQLAQEVFKLRRQVAGLRKSKAERANIERFLTIQRDLSLKILSTDKLDEIIKHAFQAILKTTGLECGGVYLADKKTGALNLFYHDGLSKAFVQEVSSYGPETLNARLVQEGKSLYMSYGDLPVPKTKAEKEEGLKCIAVVPVMYKGQPLGCVNVASRRVKEIPVESRKVIEALAGQIGYVVNRFRLSSALAESESHYRELADSISDVFFEMDKDFKYIYWNKASEDLTGIPAREALGKSLHEIFPDTRGTKVEKMYLSVLRNKRPVTFVNKYRLKGSDYFFEISAYPSHRGLSVFVKDITEKKKVEDALGESEEKFRNLVERASDGIGITQDKIMKYVNPRGAEILGYAVKEIIGTPFTNYVHPDEHPKVIRYYTQRMKGKRVPSKYESAIRNKKGQKILAEFNASVISYQAKAADMVIFRDISERKRAEEAYRTVVDSSLQGFAILQDGRVVFANSTLAKMSGYTLQELLSLSPKEIQSHYYPDDRQRILTYRQNRLAGKKVPAHQEVRFIRKDGKVQWLETLSRLIEYHGKPALQVAYIDITERKHAAEKLQESERRFKELWDNAPVAYHTIDADGIITSVNKTETNLLGYKPEEMIDRPIFDFILPEQKEEAIKRFKKKIAGESVQREDNRIYVRKDGSKVHVVIDDVTERDNKGQIIGVWTTLVDITEREQAEEALKESEARYRELVEKAESAILMDDENGNFKYFNKKYAELFGYSYEEMKKQSIKSVVHPDDVERVMRIHRKRVQGKKAPSRYEFKGIKKDGSAIYLEVDAVELKDKDRIIGTRSYIWDITERKRAEEELRASKEEMRMLAAHLSTAREQERMLIAREIHDELGQSLSALKMDLSWLDKRIPKDEQQLFEKTESMSKLIDATMKTVQKISSELRPGLLDDLGLSAAIEWEAEEFEKRTGIKCELVIEQEDITLNQDRSTAIFRIFQEALTNISRHANATRVKTSLKVKKWRLELQVKDNGLGITESQVSDPKSFGLAGIRERVDFLEGKVEIKGVQGKGTTVKVAIPLPKEGGRG